MADAPLDKAAPFVVAFPRRSPLGVYVLCRNAIEERLQKTVAAIKGKLTAAEILEQSATYGVLCKRLGARIEAGHVPPGVAWRNTIEMLFSEQFQKIKKMNAKKNKTDEEKDAIAEMMDLTGNRTEEDVKVVTSKDLTDRFVGATYRDLISLCVFLSPDVLGVMKEDSSLASWRLPAPYDKVSVALGIKENVVTDTPENSNSFSLERLMRSIKFQFVWNRMGCVKAWNYALIDISSGLFENTAVVKLMSRNDGPGHIDTMKTVYMFNPSKPDEKQARTLCADKSTTIYVAQDAISIISLHDAIMQEAAALKQLTRDDVLILQPDDLIDGVSIMP